MWRFWEKVWEMIPSMHFFGFFFFVKWKSAHVHQHYSLGQWSASWRITPFSISGWRVLQRDSLRGMPSWVLLPIATLSTCDLCIRHIPDVDRPDQLPVMSGWSVMHWPSCLTCGLQRWLLQHRGRGSLPGGFIHAGHFWCQVGFYAYRSHFMAGGFFFFISHYEFCFMPGGFV